MPFLGFVFLLNGKSFFTFGPSVGISLHLLHPYIGSEFKNLRGKLGHSQDFSKDGSQCVKVRVLTKIVMSLLSPVVGCLLKKSS